MTEEEILVAQEFHAREMDVGDGPWERWYDAVEKQLGYTLDEDGNTHGYCIDWAYDWYLKGCSVESYVQLVRTRRARRGMKP